MTAPACSACPTCFQPLTLLTLHTGTCYGQPCTCGPGSLVCVPCLERAGIAAREDHRWYRLPRRPSGYTYTPADPALTAASRRRGSARGVSSRIQKGSVL